MITFVVLFFIIIGNQRLKDYLLEEAPWTRIEIKDPWMKFNAWWIDVTSGWVGCELVKESSGKWFLVVKEEG